MKGTNNRTTNRNGNKNKSQNQNRKTKKENGNPTNDLFIINANISFIINTVNEFQQDITMALVGLAPTSKFLPFHHFYLIIEQWICFLFHL
jgi:hypothetical protein